MFLTIKLYTHAKLFEIKLLICIKMDLRLNNIRRLKCHKTQPTNQLYIYTYMGCSRDIVAKMLDRNIIVSDFELQSCYSVCFRTKLATLVEGDQKAPFSIATTLTCRRGHYFNPRLLYFTLDMYLILLSVKQGGIKYHFKVFGMMRLGIEPRSSGPLANTLPTSALLYLAR